ncbi:MAG TPA: PilN domain-containing protein [Thermoanaerobaculia bacterium]|nr:PilN domain-containing protein [Thermoanaerobaculia bacterium]
MIKINLLSEGKRAVRKAKRPALSLEGKNVGQWLLAAGALIGLLAFFLFWWMLRGELQQKQDEIQRAEAEVKRLESVIKEVEDYKQKKAELERKIGIINDLKANQRGPVRVMDYVSRALPELLWLDRMKMTASTIEIEGRAFNTNAVANFIENLDKVPEFEEPTLRDTTVQAGGVYKFVINFSYSFAPPAAPTTAAGAEGAPAGAPAAAAQTSG